MRAIRSLLALFLGVFVIGTIGSAIAAAFAKGRVEPHGDEADDEFDFVAIYNSRTFSSSAPAFRRGSALSWFGGGTIDLRGATLDPSGATLTANSMFGGIRLVVPETWRIERDTIGIFGGVGDGRGTERVDASLPALRIEGFSMFGGIGIVAEAPDLDEAAAARAESEAAAEAARYSQVAPTPESTLT